MTRFAEHLIDRVLPVVPVRQSLKLSAEAPRANAAYPRMQYEDAARSDASSPGALFAIHILL